MLNGDKWDIGLGYKEHSLQVANQQMLYLVKTCLNPNKPIFSQKLLNIFAHNLEDLRQTILYYTKYTQSSLTLARFFALTKTILLLFSYHSQSEKYFKAMK